MNNRLVVLISISSGSHELIEKSYIPLSLLYIGSILKRSGYNIKIFHIFPSEIEKTVKNIIQIDPLWCGFSVLSGGSTYWSFIASDLIKEHAPHLTIVWGGHHPTFTAQSCLQENCIDIIVRGEGELTSVELSEALVKGGIEEIKNIKGISYKKDGEIFHNKERKKIDNLDNLPLDYSLVDIDYYLSQSFFEDATIPFTSSRGCPYNCAFCCSALFNGSQYRSHSAEYVIDTITGLKRKYDIKGVSFSDDNFYVNKKRAQEIIISLKANNIDCGSLDVRLDQLKEEDCAFFRENDVKKLFFGWESGNDRILKLIRKNLTQDKILSKVEMISKYSIPCFGSGIILFPTEELDETLQTIRFASKLRELVRNSAISFFRFSPLPKIDLTKTAIEYGHKVPQSAKEWIKIDPLEKDYTIDWIPWLNAKHKKNFEYVQLLSRNGIANYSNKKNILSRIKNLFAYITNKRFIRNNYKFLIDLRLYKLMNKCYSYLLNLSNKT